MIDPFVLLTPVLLLAVLALLGFVGCDKIFQINPVSVPSTVDFKFDILSPPVTPTGAGTPLDGVYTNGPPNSLDFSTGQWLLGLGTGMESLNNIFFATGTSGSFQFADGKARRVTSLRVFTTSNGTMTLSGDNQLQTPDVMRQVNAADLPMPLSTGWTNPTVKVTVGFTAGAALGIDTITYVP